MPSMMQQKRFLTGILRLSTMVVIGLAPTACKTASGGLSASWSALTSSWRGNTGPTYVAVGHDRMTAQSKVASESDMHEQATKLTEKIKKSPRDIDAMLALARIKIIFNEAGAAETLARKILTIDFRSRPAKVVMAHAAYLQKNNQGAAAILRQLGGDGASESEALNLLACLVYADGDETHAEKILLRAVKINSADLAVHMNLGILYLRQEKYPAAEDQLNQVIKQQPDHADALAHLGVISAQQGKTAQAIEYYEKARSENPASEVAGFNMALAQKHAGAYEDAVDTLKDVLSLKTLTLAGHDAATNQLELIRNMINATSKISSQELDKIIADAKKQRSKRPTTSGADVYLTAR